MDLLQRINLAWQKIGIVQRALLVAMVIACVVTTGLLTKWASRPDMQLLFGGLSLEESSKIAEKLSEQDVLYELRAGGTSIYVESDKVYQLRATLAGQGLPEGDELGYKVFDDEKLGVSPLVQKMNYNRALQGELAKTIQMYEGVLKARVHIVRPEQTMFTGDAEGATASVMLHLRPGWSMSQSTIAAITNLVAGATEGLKPENVNVSDNNGNLLTGNASNNGIVTSANTYMDYKERVERTIANNIQNLLEGPLGPGRSKVTVNAIVDMTSKQTQTTKYEKGIPQEETTNTTSTVQDPAVGPDGSESAPGSTDKQETSESKYKVPEIVTTEIDAPGEIISLSVSAFVDLSAPSVEPKEGEAAPTTPAADIMKIEDVEEIIRNAVGSDLLKDDNSLTVKNVSFYKPPVSDFSPAKYEKFTKYIEIARQSSVGLFALCALLALKIFTKGKKQAESGEAAAALARLGTSNAGLLPAGGGGGEFEPTSAFRRQIAGQLKKDPEQVKQLFQSWLAEES